MKAIDANMAAKVMHWLNSKKLRPCSVCGSGSINVSRLVSAFGYNAAGDTVQATHTPMVQIRCDNCCHLLHFDLEAMGLIASAYTTDKSNLC
jgi:hypothetical protein